MKIRYTKPSSEVEVSIVAYSTNFETGGGVVHLSDRTQLHCGQKEVDALMKKGKKSGLAALLSQLVCDKLCGTGVEET